MKTWKNQLFYTLLLVLKTDLNYKSYLSADVYDLLVY